MSDIKRLLILFYKNSKLQNKSISEVLGISEGRLSQIMSPNKYKKGKKKMISKEKEDS
jgi:DNA-directed RNA polymerase specialized sigma subunit